jgi:3',5'-cyclic-AMP phosphodiesterase
LFIEKTREKFMNRLTKFCSILFLLGILLGFSCADFHQADEQSFRFVFMTDIHVQPELAGDEGFKQAIETVNNLDPKPEFIITGGDLIMDACKQNYERADSLYTMYSELCKNFTMPVYNGIGNHELFGLFEVSGVQTDHPDYAKEIFKKRLGQGTTYRSFNHMGWHFVQLDDIGITDTRGYTGRIYKDQLQWLTADLEKVDKSTPIVAIVHIPMMTFSEQLEKGATVASRHNVALNNSVEVLNVFKDKNLRLVLQGHEHIVEELISRDTHFITGGSVCGEWWRGPYKGFDEGFVVVDVNGKNFTWFYQTFGWDAKQHKRNQSE